MPRLFISSAALCAMAGIMGILAKAAEIAHAWAVTGGILALIAWIVFERFSRRREPDNPTERNT